MIKITYGLRHKKTGKLLQIDSYSRCDYTEWSFTTCGARDWEVDSLDRLQMAVIYDTPYYNSSEDTPQHSGINVYQDYEPVRIIKSIELEPLTIDYPEPALGFEWFFDAKEHGATVGAKFSTARPHIGMIYKRTCDHNQVLQVIHINEEERLAYFKVIKEK